jgi:tRNA threonylcarbamoyladenosine biosynthesis protein TsaB
MSILAIEFSTTHRTVAVLDPATGRSGLAEQSEGRSTDAFGLIAKALERASVLRENITRVAVGLGPGSYTGIRNAIAIAQGWEFGCSATPVAANGRSPSVDSASRVQLSGFSSVACLAYGLSAEGWQGSCRIVVDAQRGEFYAADWRLGSGEPVEETPLRIVSREAALENLPEGAVLVGPDVARLNPDLEPTFPSALVLARMAAAATEFVTGEALEPIYLRQISFVKAPPPRAIPPL